jgi:transcriptional regulator with XRE-family HTH domain
MQATTFETLRDLILHHAARQGWHTQRHVAVICGLDESALSRFLNGEQDLGARRTHALFQTVGIPIDEYDVAYALLGRAQDEARTLREGRDVAVRVGSRGSTAAESGWGHAPAAAFRHPTAALADGDIPAAVVVALFATRGYTGEQIAAFFVAR